MKKASVKAQRVHSAHMAAGLLGVMAGGALLLSVGVMVVHRQRHSASYSSVRFRALGARWVTLRARWVMLRARWVTLRARWVMLRARWVTLRARWGG
jgi:hypothetical protein